MKEIVNRYIDYMQYERNSSEHTIRSYAAILKEFVDYLESKELPTTLDAIDGDYIRLWFLQQLERGKSVKTIHIKRAVLSSFFRYCRRMELLNRDPLIKVQIPRKPKRLPVFVPESQMDQLLDDLPDPSDLMAVRDHLIVSMLYSLGLRRAELAGIKEADLSLSARQLKVLGKGNKERILPLADELLEWIQAYQLQKEMRFGPTAYLFVDSRGEQISTDMVYIIVKRSLLKVSSAKKLSPHVLRHSFATAMLNNDADISAIKSLLGHASLSSTEVYTHSTFEQLKEVYKKNHPRGDK